MRKPSYRTIAVVSACLFMGWILPASTLAQDATTPPEQAPAQTLPDLVCSISATTSSFDRQHEHSVADGGNLTLKADRPDGYIANFQVNVQNIAPQDGRFLAENFKVQVVVTDNGMPAKDLSYTLSLAGGDDAAYSPINVNLRASDDAHVLQAKATLDVDNVIQESNEGNNTCTFKFTARVEYTPGGGGSF